MAQVDDFLRALQGAVGKPYQLGATGPDAYDCSGLVQRAAGAAGQTLPRTTWDQVKAGSPVQGHNLAPGDLVFSTWDNEAHPAHVAVYVGDGKVISAPQPGQPVGYATLNDAYWSHVDAVRRLSWSDGSSGDAGGLAGQALDALLPSGLVGAVQSAADGLRGVAQGAQAVGSLSSKLMWFALPTTQVRIAAGVFGVGFIAVGLTFLVREARS